MAKKYTKIDSDTVTEEDTVTRNVRMSDVDRELEHLQRELAHIQSRIAEKTKIKEDIDKAIKG